MDGKPERYHKVNVKIRVIKWDPTGTETVAPLKTLHQNTITQVSVFSGSKANCGKISTSAMDGQIIIWDLKSLEKSLPGLTIS